MSEDIQKDKQQAPVAGDEQASGATETSEIVAETEQNTVVVGQVQEEKPVEQVQAPVFDQPVAEPLPLAKVKLILEAAMLAAGQPLPVEKMLTLFSEHEQPGREVIHQAMAVLAEDCAERGIEIKEVASGYRLQVRQDFEPWVSRLWEERAPRYTRALLETLALMAYRQPITRGEIESIRGVSVSSNIVKTLLERDWIRVIGHRDVPGRPAMYATTKGFLDYFGLKGLEDLPALSELRDIDSLNVELDLGLPGETPKSTESTETAESVPDTSTREPMPDGAAEVVAVINAAASALQDRAEMETEVATVTGTDKSGQRSEDV